MLLVHGTWTKGEDSWGWGYARALPRDGHKVCYVNLPDLSLNDVQTSTEYVVYALRHMYKATGGRKISMIAHSQGGLEALWALKYWPDLSGRVDDLIAFASPFQGTHLGNELCAPGKCHGAEWQFRRGSKLTGAINRGALPAGPSYTSVGTYADEFVRPMPDATRLPGASNIIVQDRCPARPVEHVALLGDAVFYAYALDALRHPGPAVPGRVPLSTCLNATLPNIDPAGALAGSRKFACNLLLARTNPMVRHEPPLREYVPAG